MFLSDLTGLSSLDAPTAPLKDYLVSCSPSKTILAVIWNPKNVPEKIKLDRWQKGWKSFNHEIFDKLLILRLPLSFTFPIPPPSTFPLIPHMHKICA